FQASLSALTVVVRKFRSVSSLVAEGGRLGGLEDALADAAARASAGDGVSVEDLAFAVGPGERLVVTGESGCGKTTLVRALAGLWAEGSGRVRRSGDAVFAPQDPYIPADTLRRVLTFPAPDRRLLRRAGHARSEGGAARYRPGAPRPRRRGGLGGRALPRGAPALRFLPPSAAPPALGGARRGHLGAGPRGGGGAVLQAGGPLRRLHHPPPGPPRTAHARAQPGRGRLDLRARGGRAALRTRAVRPPPDPLGPGPRGSGPRLCPFSASSSSL
ncbi:unnamed protein product, partial [Prorocentrum cordatum]